MDGALGLAVPAPGGHVTTRGLLLGLSLALNAGLLVACVVLAAIAVRGAEHDAYHRSKAAEHALRSELLLTWPPGTGLETFLDDLAWPTDDPRLVRRGGLTEVYLRPPPAVPEPETRDYPGFVVRFDGGVLMTIESIGPDGHAPDIRLDEAMQRAADRRAARERPPQ